MNMKVFPAAVQIDESDAQKIGGLLAQDWPSSRAALRWLRNAFRPLPIVERFVFYWLALENMAGATNVEKVCPTCGSLVKPQKAGRVFAQLNAKGVGKGKGSPKFP